MKHDPHIHTQVLTGTKHIKISPLHLGTCNRSGLPAFLLPDRRSSVATSHHIQTPHPSFDSASLAASPMSSSQINLTILISRQSNQPDPSFPHPSTHLHNPSRRIFEGSCGSFDMERWRAPTRPIVALSRSKNSRCESDVSPTHIHEISSMND